MQIKIAKKKVGENSPTFIIAEAGINHNGDLNIAKKMIKKAKEAKVDAIKFQTFKADDLASPKSQYYKIFKNLEFSSSDFEKLATYAKNINLIFCSTPFSENAVDTLSKIKVPFFKIASGDLTHIPLIKYAASKRKPMLISTGMANMDEIKMAIKAIKSQGNNEIVILHSVSAYPTPPEETNLNAIKSLKKNFLYPIGYSDNGPGNTVPLTAVCLGAKVIEKHFTLDKKMKGPDQFFSGDPNEFKELVKKTREIEKILGDGVKKCQKLELSNLINARRSITTNMDIDKGVKISKEMISIKRPATGIHPMFINKVFGRKTRVKVKINESLKWQDLI
jgi:N,N'-diacetyllegionaminate synthase